MKKLFIFCFTFLFVGFVHATPISYSYDGAWSSNYSGNFGSTYLATITFDNGGSDITNQNFGQSDFLSASLSSGTYNNSWLSTDITSWYTNFTSNSSGILGGGWMNLSNSGGYFHFDNYYQDENASNGNGSASYFSSHTSNVGQLASVPEPTSLALLGLGLAGFGFSRKKKKA